MNKNSIAYLTKEERKQMDEEISKLKEELVPKYRENVKQLIQEKEAEKIKARTTEFKRASAKCSRNLYLAINKDGRTELTDNLIDWCKQHNLTYVVISADAYYENHVWRSGWHVVKLNTKELEQEIKIELGLIELIDD